jgi:outer membrane protein OmpA-like peptidoglycan-associated protein
MIRVIILSLGMLFLLVEKNSAQATNKAADKAALLQKYQKAIKLYKKGLENGGDTLYNSQKLADTYYKIGDWQNAENWYAKIADKQGVTADVLERYADVLRTNKKFTEATKYYDASTKAAKTPSPRVKEIVSNMDKIRVLDRPQPAYTVELLPFNTSRSEKSPTLMGYGKILVSSNKLKNGNKPDKRKNFALYEANTDSSSPLVKYTGSGITKKYNYNSTANSGNELIYSKNRHYKCAKKSLKDSAYSELYSLTLPDGNSVRLPIQAAGASFASPSLSPDGKTLYFSSNKTGGLGGFDIYFSKKDGSGNWSQPESLGKGVNSEYNETYPFIGSDGTLYFSSDAPVGLGGLDIYKTKQVLGEWTKPVNMGNPVNSGGNDFGIVLDSSNAKGFFTSNRSGGMGGDDIYKLTIDRSKLDYEITVRVLDADLRSGIAGALVGLKCNNMNLDEVTTDNAGNAILKVRGGQKCSAEISKVGFSSVSIPLSYNERLKPKEVSLKRNEIKLLVSVTEVETGKPVRDAAITITSKSNSGVKTFATDATGTFECKLDPSNQYEVASPDYTSVSDNITPTEADLTAGAIKRTYAVNSNDVKINVPLTADCFTPNSLLTVTDVRNGQSFKAQADEKGYVRLDLLSNNVYVFEQNNISDTVKTFGLMPGDVVQDHCKFFVGQTWLVDNIYYDLNQSVIRKDAAKDLDRLVRIMKAHTTLEIELGSHTDCRSSVAYNNMLSARRAKAAVDYIGAKGISKKKIIAAGYGETKLLNGCACEPTNTSTCTDAEHAINRRTEVKVLKY